MPSAVWTAEDIGGLMGNGSVLAASNDCKRGASAPFLAPIGFFPTSIMKSNSKIPAPFFPSQKVVSRSALRSYLTVDVRRGDSRFHDRSGHTAR